MPAITRAKVMTACREEAVTPPLIIWASREGSIISPTAAASTRADSSRICRPLSFALEKIVFIGYSFRSGSVPVRQIEEILEKVPGKPGL